MKKSGGAFAAVGQTWLLQHLLTAGPASGEYGRCAPPFIAWQCQCIAQHRPRLVNGVWRAEWDGQGMGRTVSDLLGLLALCVKHQQHQRQQEADAAASIVVSYGFKSSFSMIYNVLPSILLFAGSRYFCSSLLLLTQVAKSSSLITAKRCPSMRHRPSILSCG